MQCRMGQQLELELELEQVVEQELQQQRLELRWLDSMQAVACMVACVSNIGTQAHGYVLAISCGRY